MVSRKRGMALFCFFPRVLACVAPPLAMVCFQTGFLDMNLCVDTEGHEGERGYSSLPSSGGGGIDALRGGASEEKTPSMCSGTTRSQRILWRPPIDHMVSSALCLLLCTWLPWTSTTPGRGIFPIWCSEGAEETMFAAFVQLWTATEWQRVKPIMKESFQP